jgi:hypothetical protein
MAWFHARFISGEYSLDNFDQNLLVDSSIAGPERVEEMNRVPTCTKISPRQRLARE